MRIKNLRKKYLKADIRDKKNEVHWQMLVLRLAWASLLSMYIIVKKDDEATLVKEGYDMFESLEEDTELVMFYRVFFTDENGKEYGIKTKVQHMTVKKRAKCVKCYGSGRYIVGVTQDGRPIDRGVCRGCSGKEEVPGTQTWARLEYHYQRLSELRYEACMRDEE